MSDEETRNRRQQRRKRNIYAKVLRTPQFLPKIKDHERYKRKRLSVREIEIDESDKE